uniref:NADH-ubiquinone oxidoreductase chain 3 n=1 Tax=Eurylepta cornuta TaxID=1879303 RepID=A0A2R3SK57_9PLAT|nr:NADH dehydrogenase subunit 3 [Eurylepta cornuta]
MLIALIMVWAIWSSRKNYINSREKSSPFECGFDPKDKARIPFSLRFFIIIILFIIFDVELSLLLQLPLQFENGYFKSRVLISLFIWILLLGTLEEWRRGVLSWKD